MIISILIQKLEKHSKWLSKPHITILVATILIAFYTIMMYSKIDNWGGEYPLGIVVSLFLSFAIILYFYVENIQIYFRKKRLKNTNK